METIIEAALFYDGAIWTTINKPSRHHHIFKHLYNIYDDNRAADAEQGFTTNLGRFVDREEALEIAKNAGQIHKPLINSKELFSEDLW